MFGYKPEKIDTCLYQLREKPVERTKEHAYIIACWTLFSGKHWFFLGKRFRGNLQWILTYIGLGLNFLPSLFPWSLIATFLVVIYTFWDLRVIAKMPEDHDLFMGKTDVKFQRTRESKCHLSSFWGWNYWKIPDYPPPPKVDLSKFFKRNKGKS